MYTWFLIVCLLANAAMLCSPVASRAAVLPESTPSDRALYHSDPDHLWNRLHGALFIRVGPNGQAYGQDRFEPLLWSNSKHLLEGNSHQRAVAVLDEFLKNDGEKLIQVPLKRAILQRDLWLLANWLEGDHGSFQLPLLEPGAVRSAVLRLRRPLAAVIARLALKPEEIQSLPNNYEAAVASGDFASSFDLDKPERPYLPPQLFAPEGPWVCVGRADGLTGPRHLEEDSANRFTNSVFLVFLQLPAGRDATVNYLKRLRSFKPPLLVPNPDASDPRSNPFVPNPELPQFPKGTEIALVRRMMLIDSLHQVETAPITESVQLRIIHGDVPSVTAQILDYAFHRPAARSQIRSWQSFHELRLSRSRLFENVAGGLRFVAADEGDFKTGFNAHPYDIFEMPLGANESFSAQHRQPTIRRLCFDCHALPGVYSFNSVQNFRAGIRRDGDKLRPFPLSPMSISEVSAAAVKWKEGRPSWISLRALLAE